MSVPSHSTAQRVPQGPLCCLGHWAAWTLTNPPSPRAAGDNGAEGGPGEGAQQVPAVGRVLHRGQDVSAGAHRGHAAGGPGRGAAASAEVPCASDRAIDDKYSRREEYRGFTQDIKEKDGYKPDVKIEYVDETGRKLTPKEVSGAAPWSLGWGTVVSIALGGTAVPPLQAWQEGVFVSLPPPQPASRALTAGGNCSPFLFPTFLGFAAPSLQHILPSLRGLPEGARAGVIYQPLPSRTAPTSAQPGWGATALPRLEGSSGSNSVLPGSQAFRQLSHRFHGKGSGKMKTERRMKKLDEEAVGARGEVGVASEGWGGNEMPGCPCRADWPRPTAPEEDELQ